MGPPPNIEHRDLIMRISAILYKLFGGKGEASILPGANVSDREEGWEQNFRCPDVVVAFRGGQARNCAAYW